MADRICAASECLKLATGGRGLCPMHYRRLRKHGSTDDPKIDNFARYEVNTETGCWVWTGPTDGKGYGFFSRSYCGEFRAHRAFWVREHGPIVDGMEMDHLCRNRGCVNPDHLEQVTHWENTQRSRRGQWGTERCLSGKHDVTSPEAWVTYPGRPNDRSCRACAQESNAQRAARARRKAASGTTEAP